MKDNFEVYFNKELEFLSFLQDMESEAKWLRTPTNSLRAVTAKNIDAAARITQPCRSLKSIRILWKTLGCM